MDTPRGRLLFTTRSLTRWLAYLLVVVAAIAIGASFLEAYIKFWNIKTLVAAILAALLGAADIFRRLRYIKFYENGIFFPEEESDSKDRFIGWHEIARFSWEGDVLTVVPSPILTTGGEPLTGGSVKVPKARRAEVERLLAQAAAAP